MRPFFLRKHPCPECFGSISWLARLCPHCKHRITISERFELMPSSAHVPVFIFLSTFFALTGHSLLNLVGVL